MEPHIGTFCEYYELQRQQKGDRLEISFAQMNKWNKDWMQYWFYVRTSGMTSMDSEGKKTHPLPVGIRDDPDEAFDSRNSWSGDF